MGVPRNSSGHFKDDKDILPYWESKSDTSVIQPIRLSLYQLTYRHKNIIKIQLVHVYAIYHSVDEFQWHDVRITVRENRPTGKKTERGGGGG
jgi:hypothetical protein